MDRPRPGSTRPPIVYLAGPEVFLPDGKEIGQNKRAICMAHGFDAVFPLDKEPSGEQAPAAIASEIFSICVEMMESCDLVVANMTPFRGVSMDVGTAVEIGYMYARGKPIFAYTNVADDYFPRVKTADVAEIDEAVEDFGLSDNLMCEMPVLRSGSRVMRYAVPGNRVLTDLRGFEACVVDAKRVYSLEH